jgi:hypothetical protein
MPAGIVSLCRKLRTKSTIPRLSGIASVSYEQKHILPQITEAVQIDAVVQNRRVGNYFDDLRGERHISYSHVGQREATILDNCSPVTLILRAKAIN